MKKRNVFKKVVIGTGIIGLTGIATTATAKAVQTFAEGGNVSNILFKSKNLTDLKDFDYNDYCNNQYDIEKVAYILEDANSFVEDFNDSLDEFTMNGSYLAYSDAEGEIPYMYGYIEGLGHIKGMRESTCGDSEYSSWIYVIEDAYFSRITLSTSKIAGFKLFPANSDFYYSSTTWYANNDSIKTPMFEIIDGEVVNNYASYEQFDANLNVLTPTFNENYQMFKGDFLKLDKKAQTLYGVANSNYNRNQFSYENLDEAIITDFQNFWFTQTENEYFYLMNGRYAEIQLKKLLISMFSNKIKPCNNFELDCVKSKEDVCAELGSYYNANFISSQFFKFDFDFVTKDYYKQNNINSDDLENKGYYNITKKEYEELEAKPFIEVIEKGEKESIITFHSYVYKTTVKIIK